MLLPHDPVGSLIARGKVIASDLGATYRDCTSRELLDGCRIGDGVPGWKFVFENL